MSPTSIGGGVTSRTGGEHISRLVEMLIGRFRLRRNLNNCIINGSPNRNVLER